MSYSSYIPPGSRPPVLLAGPFTGALDLALALAAQGLRVFPCAANKRPAIPEVKGGSGCLDATDDPADIRSLFAVIPNAPLVGVACGPGSNVDVLDVDPRHGGDAWERANATRLPATLIHGTPSGGRHYVFRHAPGVRNRQGVPAPGVDVRGEGGYVIWPPSAGYTVLHNTTPADWPQWLLDLVIRTKPPPRPVVVSDPTQVSDARLNGLLRSLLTRLRNAPEGQKHETLLRIARTLGGYAHLLGMADAQLVALMLDALPDTVRDWQSADKTARDGLAHGRASPLQLEDRPNPISMSRHQPRSRATPADAPPPTDQSPEQPSTPRDQDHLGPEPPPAEPPDDGGFANVVSGFNSRYCVVNENGKALVYSQQHDCEQNRKIYIRYTFHDFEKLHMNRKLEVVTPAGRNVVRNYAQIWLGHPNRRQYLGGVVFAPGKDKEIPMEANTKALNLWDGYAVEPAPGSWARLQEHLLNNVCHGDTDLMNYLLDWMADLIQRPARQGEVAIVLRGREGCGKGTVAKALKYLLGQHALAISNAKHLTSNFNSHLRDVVFLFADEAFYAGDKQHTGVLKSIVTEPYLTIEGKFQAVYQATNYLHVMMASNEDWVVPAGLDSRRWCVLDVAPDRIGDHVYFGAIQQELAAGGYQAMLHDLLHRNLNHRNRRAVPVTRALVEQRIHTLMSTDMMAAWWLDCLQRGFVFASKLGLEEHWRQWHTFLPTDVLLASYQAFCRAHGERRPKSRTALGTWLAASGYVRAQAAANAAVAEHLFGTAKEPRLVMKYRPWGRTLGELNQARSAFISFTNLPPEWEESEPV